MEPIAVNIIKDRQERFSNTRGKRAYFVNAWRIVFDGTDKDVIQPWSNTKRKALEMCEIMGYRIVVKKVKL